MEMTIAVLSKIIDFRSSGESELNDRFFREVYSIEGVSEERNHVIPTVFRFDLI